MQSDPVMPPKSSPQDAVPRWSIERIVVGIASTLVATGVGAYIGHKIGSWGNKAAKVVDGKVIHEATSNAGIFFSAIFGLFSGGLAWHANLSGPDSASLEEDKQALAQARRKPEDDPKKRPVVRVTGGELPDQEHASTVQVPATHEGLVQAASAHVDVTHTASV